MIAPKNINANEKITEVLYIRNIACINIGTTLIKAELTILQIQLLNYILGSMSICFSCQGYAMFRSNLKKPKLGLGLRRPE